MGELAPRNGRVRRRNPGRRPRRERVTLSLTPPSSAGDGYPWTVVLKQADESVASSATVQADDELFFTPASGGLYDVFLWVVYASPSGAGTPDITVAFGQDGTMRGTLSVLGVSTGDGANAASIQAQTGSTQNFGTAATNRALRMFGQYFGSGAQAGLWWAQATAGANPTIVRAGSMFWYRRLA